MRWRTEATRRIFDWFSRFDLLLLPTSPIEAFAVGQIGPKEIAGRKVSPFAWVSWTSPFNITRQPALSLPCGLTADGLPVGLQIVAPYGADDLLLRFAAAMEERLAFSDRFGPKSSLPVK
jgi:aspartyl-tRNA(Asn)/glutamyl-tRNA(Gln) amidotransferase subunit A